MSYKESYFNFEKKFRGSREEILSRLKAYDNLLNTIKKCSDQPRVLDIGCGRGEWLSKCKEMGFDCLGIDLDDEMIEECSKYEIDTIKGSVLDVLKDISVSSFDLITSFHLVEHLTNEELTDMFLESKRILKSNGLFVLETPSIDNLVVSSRSFYLDPTHINHINPDRITFSLNEIGFYKSKYYFINCGPLKNSEPLRLTRILNGVAEDLLIISAPTKYSSDLFFNQETDWKEDLTEGMNTMSAAVEFDEEIKNQTDKIESLLIELKNLKLYINDLHIPKYDRNINNIVDSLENDIKFLKEQTSLFDKRTQLFERQIEYILYRQNKIYNVLPLRVIRRVKSLIFSLIGRIFKYFIFYLMPIGLNLFSKLRSIEIYLLNYFIFKLRRNLNPRNALIKWLYIHKLFKLILHILDKIHSKKYLYKLKAKEKYDSDDKINNNHLKFFDSSNEAQQISKEIKSALYNIKRGNSK